MPIQLNIRWDLSLQDLVVKQRAGFPVFKTPHVGNWYINNLACAALGIPMKVVDGTKGCLDRNFHPDRVILNGQSAVVTQADILTSHAKVNVQLQGDMGRWFELGQSTSQAHMQALQRAIPQMQAQTVSDYIQEHRDRVLAVLETITRFNPSIWERYSQEDGVTISRRPWRGWDTIVMDGIVGIDGNRRGWVIPNIANILMDITIDPVRFQTDTIYELSGPDMYRYIDPLMPKLNAYYDLIRSTLEWGLPEVVNFNLVPVSDMRFAVPESRRKQLETLVDAWCQLESFESRVGARMKSALQKREEIDLVICERRDYHDRLLEAMRNCPDPFYDIYDGTFFSQYDLLQQSEDLFIHPWAIETPVGKLTEAVRLMRKLQT